MKKITLLLLSILVLNSCKDDDDSTTIKTTDITLKFTQSWNDASVSESDFDTTVYTIEIGQDITISRIRYMLSNIEITSASGTVVNLLDFQLIDLSDPTTFDTGITVSLPEGSYLMSFVHGFTEEDNIDNGYEDLNVASWNWPSMLGGGYHFMQFDGMYNVLTTAPMPFNYHNGTARVSDGVFEQNFVQFSNKPVTISGDEMTIIIHKNIAEWFKSPNLWDLEVYNTPLMPNYEAQKLMQQNAVSVYTVTTTPEID